MNIESCMNPAKIPININKIICCISIPRFMMCIYDQWMSESPRQHTRFKGECLSTLVRYCEGIAAPKGESQDEDVRR